MIYLAEPATNTERHYDRIMELVTDDLPPLRILYSYHYWKDIDLKQRFYKHFGDEKWPWLFVDSGGFSAATQGVSVSIEEYVDYLKNNEDVINLYANFDVIGDPQQTYDNQKRMEDFGLTPIPVFHAGSKFEWLRTYLGEGYRYICLGGMVPYSKNLKVLIAFISKCFQIAQEYEGEVYFHGFGLSNWKLLRAWPWASIDSSSWAAGTMYGNMILFDEEFGVFRKVDIRDPNTYFPQRELLEQYGVTPDDFLGYNFNRKNVVAASIISFLKAEKYFYQNCGWKTPMPEANVWQRPKK